MRSQVDVTVASLGVRPVEHGRAYQGERSVHGGHPDPGYRAWLPIVLYAALAVVLALSRLSSGPWYDTWNPQEVSLMDGWPAAWESQYYTDHLATFASKQAPGFGIAPVHYRTFLPLYLAGTLYGWTGSAFWSFAVVDIACWMVAGAAALALARRLGASEVAATAAGALVTASPVLVSHMWRHDLHTADFASLPIATWAALTLIDEHRKAWRLAVGLGATLLIVSLCYQYQWVLAPVLVVWAGTHPRLGLWRGIGLVGASVVLYALANVASQRLFLAGVGPPTEWVSVTIDPAHAILERVMRVQSVGDALGLLPNVFHVVLTLDSYHPLVVVAGIIGLWRLGWRVALATLAGMASSLYSTTIYPTPWAATTSYPLVYVAAGTGCAYAGTLVANAFRRWSARGTASRASNAPWATPTRIALVCTALVTFVLAASTNLDLIGMREFSLRWWYYFAGQYVF